MKIAIVSPVLAMRAGLRAMLSGTAAPEGASLVLEEMAPVLQVIYEAASLEEDELAFSLSEVDVIILTEEASRPALKQALAAADDPPALLMLADRGALAQELADLPVRAWGLLQTDATAEELLAAAQAVHQGLLVGAPVLVARSLAKLFSAKAGDRNHLVETLTERESQVLELLARGLANKQIALELGISEHTVKFHVSSIYTKLDATNRADAVRTGIQQGLVSL